MVIDISKFEELNDNLNLILNALVGSQNLCKYLYYDSPSPLSEPNITDVKPLFFNRIYPYPIIPGIQDEAKTMITVILDDFNMSNNSSFKTSNIIINVFCHIDLWPINDGELRPYGILSEIEKSLNEKRLIGIGKLQFNSCRWFAVNDKFSVYQIKYRVVDFN